MLNGVLPVCKPSFVSRTPPLECRSERRLLPPTSGRSRSAATVRRLSITFCCRSWRGRSGRLSHIARTVLEAGGLRISFARGPHAVTPLSQGLLCKSFAWLPWAAESQRVYVIALAPTVPADSQNLCCPAAAAFEGALEALLATWPRGPANHVDSHLDDPVCNQHDQRCVSCSATATRTPPGMAAVSFALHFSSPSRLWQRYNLALKSSPIATKSLTCMSAYGVGDIIAQISFSKAARVADRITDVDAVRTARMALYGLLWCGPAGHAFYAGLDKVRFPAFLPVA
jgi:hypothetical protein